MTKIEWTEQTWNPIVGCSVTSPGCTNCYAMRQAHRLASNPATPHYAGTTKMTRGGPVFTGKVALASDRVLTAPLHRKKPTVYFVNSMGDLFHEDVPDEWIDRVFAIMALTPQHTYQVLTKRADRMREYVLGLNCDGARRWNVASAAEKIATERMIWVGNGYRSWDGLGKTEWDQTVCNVLGSINWPLPNVWLGVSAEDQPRADQRIPDLLATPAAVRFVSVEPMLGPVDLTKVCRYTGRPIWDALRGIKTVGGYLARSPSECSMSTSTTFKHPSLDWVICGGESGGSARPMHPDWARSLRDQCAAAGVPFFFKQWGEWELSLDRDKDDPDWQQDYSRKYSDEGKSRWLNIEGGRGFHGDRFCVMRRVGKKAAGRLLDGVQHDGRPQ